MKSFERRLQDYKERLLPYEIFLGQLQGWFGYAKWAKTYNLRKRIIGKINKA